MKNISRKNSMKRFLQILSITAILTNLVSCAYIKSQEQDSKGALLFSLLQNAPNNFKPETLKSVVYLAKTDISTFQGTCVDSFYGTITAANYYDMNYKAMMDAVAAAPTGAPAKAYATSSSCSQLGFAGLGADQAANSGVKYKAYYCDASYSACSDNAITGKINGASIIGKGSDGVVRGSAFDCTARPNWFCQ